MNFFNIIDLSKEPIQDFDRKEINEIAWKELNTLNKDNFRQWHLEIMLDQVQPLTTLLK